MNKQSIREIFDNISLSVISFLENHIGITDVEFVERQGKLNLLLKLTRCPRKCYRQVGGRKCPFLTTGRLQGLPLDL